MSSLALWLKGGFATGVVLTSYVHWRAIVGAEEAHTFLRDFGELE